MQLTIECTVLESILERAARASRLVGYIDKRARDTIVEPLGDNVDEIVHLLSELLGNPELITTVPSACAAFGTESVARDADPADRDGPESAAAGAPR